MFLNSILCNYPSANCRCIIRHNIGPILAAKSRLLLLGQCRRLHRSSAGPTTAIFVVCLNFCRPSAETWPSIGLIPSRVSLFPRQTILKVRKPEFGTASARCCAKNKCWKAEFGPELAANCIPELSFQQQYDIGNQSSAIFLPMLGQCDEYN